MRDTAQAISPFGGEQFWKHCKGYEGWRWELCAAAWFVGEKLWRWWGIQRKTKVIRVIKHPYGESSSLRAHLTDTIGIEADLVLLN